MDTKMKTEIIKKNDVSVAVINSSRILIKDVPSALDLVINMKPDGPILR